MKLSILVSDLEVMHLQGSRHLIGQIRCRVPGLLTGRPYSERMILIAVATSEENLYKVFDRLHGCMRRGEAMLDLRDLVRPPEREEISLFAQESAPSPEEPEQEMYVIPDEQ